MSSQQNLLLASLSSSDGAALRPFLKSVQLAHQAVLFEAGGEINRVYFPTGAIVSMVVTLSSGETLEAAMVGKDGAVGALAALDGGLSLSRAVVQLAGTAMVCDGPALKSAALQSHSLLSALVRDEQTIFAQVQQSAACMAAHSVESRLCRWLLRARDLADSDTLHFTHEYVAAMLGVRRTSVTLVARGLQQAGMIKYTRGKIQLTDIEAMQETVCECYGTVKSYYETLLLRPLE
jgi:CRP-like cAMP-binding protein